MSTQPKVTWTKRGKASKQQKEEKNDIFHKSDSEINKYIEG